MGPPVTVLTIVAAISVALAPLAAAPTAQDTVAPGTITVEPLPDDAASPAARQLFAEAVESALNDASFLALPANNRGRYLARMKLSRRAEGSVAVDATEAGADGNVGNWGARLAVTLPSSKRQMRTLIVTQLDVQILRRDGMQPVWTGRALTVKPQGTPEDAPAVIAKKLANAVMRVFPQQMADPVSVP